MAWRESFRQSRKLCRWERSPGGAVAQRLRGFKSAEPEKTVKRSSRRTGVNLQFFPVEPTSLGLKGASSPFFVAPARRNRWHFSGSLLVSKENIPGYHLLPLRSAFQIIQHNQKGRCTVRCSGLWFPHFYFAVLIKLRLSHRYLMPEMAVTAATSQHRAIETTTTMETLSTVPR